MNKSIIGYVAIAVIIGGVIFMFMRAGTTEVANVIDATDIEMEIEEVNEVDIDPKTGDGDIELEATTVRPEPVSAVTTPTASTASTDSEQPPQQRDGTQPTGGGGGQGGPDLATAAVTLGVTEAELIAVLGEPGQSQPDLAAAAVELGITEDELIAALGVAAGGQQQARGPR